jgi:glycosyltransferase involved in cell wall biosynthesis
MFGGTLLNKTPYVLCTDLTPVQYDDMAEHYNHKPDKTGLISKYKRRVNTKVFKQAAHILPWTQWTRNSFMNDYGVPTNNLTIVPIGVDTNLWRPLQENNRQGRIRILFVGGDFYRKGGSLLLRAFRQLPSGASELHIVTRTAVEPQENITVHNHLQPNSPELVSLFQSCDIFVLPTKADAFGIVAVERRRIAGADDRRGRRV